MCLSFIPPACGRPRSDGSSDFGRIGSFLAPAVIGYMLAYGLGAYVLYTFAVAYLIAAIALWFVGVETKGRVLEEINQTKPSTG